MAAIAARGITPGMRVTGWVLTDDTVAFLFGGAVVETRHVPATEWRGDLVWLNYRMSVPGDCWQAFNPAQRLTVEMGAGQ